TGIRPPLTVGKSWSFKNTALNTKAGNSLKRSGTAKVVAQESVTTSAGTFDTFKIETTLQEDNAADATKKLQFVLETWYAPAIDHWVKRTSVTRSNNHVMASNSMELVEYGRKK
ncbi:TapB family protein, partial [Neisseria gonorrhoeae]|uniref:TapB family protein n=1 Tax=Neisseria gonorrhoeae TaxID=485 RepID=UPI001649B953